VDRALLIGRYSLIGLIVNTFYEKREVLVSSFAPSLRLLKHHPPDQ
jgi:hypothetical protein